MSATISSEILTISGTEFSDNIAVTRVGNQFVVTDNGVTSSFESAAVKSISIDAKAGNDLVTLDSTVDRPANISGGSGRDTLTGGAAADNISGGRGDDVLRGNGGADRLYGDVNPVLKDILVKPIDAAKVSVIGKLVTATSPRASALTNAVSASLVGKTFVSKTSLSTDLISKDFITTRDNGFVSRVIDIGKILNPIIVETDNDLIYGSSGNDYMHGSDGNDTLHGESGADTAYGGAGSDQLFGGANADRLFGEADADTLEGGSASDYIDGGAAIDKILSNDGDLMKFGSRSVYGAIGIKYIALGGEGGFLGQPLNSETGTGDGIGRYNDFAGGSIYWTGATGAQVIYGAIRDMWDNLGAERSFLGYPTSDELQDGGERLSRFQNGEIAWSGATGAYLRKVDMKLMGGDAQYDDWSCGPNSVSRVLRFYGYGDATYSKVRSVQLRDSDLVSRFKMGSRPGTLLQTMKRWKADSYRESRTSFDRVLQVLSEGKPVIALVGTGRDYTFGLGSVPKKLHWIALTGFDKKTQQIFFMDTDGKEKVYTFAQFNQVWNWYSSGAKGGFLTGTMDVPERTILY
jgi:Ca2+-binding RTX toxin-like protein